MKKSVLFMVAALLAVQAIPNCAQAGNPPVAHESTVASDCDCEACRAKVGGRIKAKRTYEGTSSSFSCSCQGSYKFPVPPLYTYHWPGMYSAQRMTDYHSPWRFPPLKSYADEPRGRMTKADNPVRLQPIDR